MNSYMNSEETPTLLAEFVISHIRGLDLKKLWGCVEVWRSRNECSDFSTEFIR